MTRKEARELLPLIQAYAEGKTIQRIDDKNEWSDLCIVNFDYSPNKYRIKPEPKYRPFKTQEECWQEMLKHQPFGWLKDKNDGHLTLITVVDNDKWMALNGRVGWEFLGMMNNYVFADGTPFGVKIEKEE